MAYSDIDSGKVLNKEGLLELCNQIKAEIANNSSGGGASYTAGKGINIDVNNVISNNATLFNSVYGNIISSGTLSNNGNDIFSPFNSFITATADVDVLASNLKKYGIGWISGRTNITTASLNEAMGTSFEVVQLSFGVNTDTITSNNYLATNTSNSLGELRKDYYIIITAQKYVMAEINTWRYLFGAHIGNNITFPTGTNYAAFRLKGIIPQLDAAISTKLTAPTAPTTDGTYTLQCVVSSGTPTYSWVSVS